MTPPTLALLLAGLLGTAPPLAAQPEQAGADPEAVRQALVPFQELSQRLPPMLRERLHAHARAWAALSPEEQAQLRENLSQWETLETQHKLALRARFDAWEQMDPATRKRAIQTGAHFSTLPESVQQRWRERFDALPAQQRQSHLYDPSTRAVIGLARELFPFIPAQDHNATLAMLRELDEAQVATLRNRLARLPPARRDTFRQSLLDMDAEARAAELGAAR
ncbi:DUF3106 domain-containing protein [Denitratimonas sp. CY0512]|uniref:DUF3106 domain-containing protein n=1 Tax=Denitratimonas sp. CY0512 TaxID=3131940 RepID=UPI0030B4648A